MANTKLPRRKLNRLHSDKRRTPADADVRCECCEEKLEVNKNGYCAYCESLRRAEFEEEE